MRGFSGGVVLALALCGAALGQVPAAVMSPLVAPKTILLWPNGAPGAQGDDDPDKPSLTIYLPAGVNATKTGVVVAPGGGYQHLSMTREGSDVAAWLNARGVAAFVLKYRLGPKYHYPAEPDDAQRAIRYVRANAAGFGVAEDHIGMWGFSAGGHLTATAGTHFDSGKPAATDAVEQKPSRPDFLVLAYPVITFQEPYLHRGSMKYLLGDSPDPALARSLSAELQVTANTPPTFLFATTDDHTVPVVNSVMFYSALVKAGVPVEMHLFQHGVHGSGLAPANPELSIWPDLLAKWMRQRGYMAPQ